MAERSVTIKVSADDKDILAKLEEMGLKAQETANKITDSFGAKFKAKMDAAFKALPDIQINADSSEADRKIVEIKAELDDLRTKKIGIDLSDTEAVAKIDELRLKLERLGAESPSVRIKVDTAAAIAQLDLFKKAANDSSGSSGGGGLSGLASSIAGVGGALGSLGPIALGVLATALIPLGAAAAGAALGLTGMALAAGAAVGAFGIAALPVFKQVSTAITQIDADQKAIARSTSLASYANNVQKLNLDLKNLNPTVASLTLGVLNIKQAFMEWDAQFNPDILRVFKAASADVKPILNELTPLVHAGADALDGFFKSIGQVAKSTGFSNFIAFLYSQAGPAIKTITTAVELFGKGFATGLEKSAPLIKDVERGIVSLAKGFANFAASKSFQDFIDYVRKNGPAVVDDVKKIATGIAHAITVLAPFGLIVLNVVADVISVIGKIGTVVNSLAAFFSKTLPHAASVFQAALRTAVQSVVNDFITYWHAIDSNFVQPLTNFFTKTIPHSLSVMTGAFTTGFQSVHNDVTTYWHAIDKAFQSVHNDITTYWHAIENDFVHPLTNFFTQTVPHALSVTSGAFTTGFQSIHNIVNTVWHAIDNDFVHPLTDFFTVTIPHDISLFVGFFTAIPGQVNHVWSDVVEALHAAWSSVANWVNGTIVQPVVNFFQGIPGGVNHVWNDVAGALYSAWGALSGWVMTNVVDPITGAFAGLESDVIGVVNHLISAYNSIPVLPNVSNINNPFTGPGQAGPAGPAGSMAHATGGIFTKAHLGLVAEAGPEAILPLNDPKRTLDILGQVLGGNGGAAANPASGGSSVPAIAFYDTVVNNGTDWDQMMNRAAFAVASKRF